MTEPPTSAWERTVQESVGRIIEFWGFKRNQGRVWALLYLAEGPQGAPAIGRRLGLSKGAVSMVLRELETWAVVRRVPAESRSGVAYAAEQDLWLMISTVLRQREQRLVGQVLADLQAAERDAAADPELTPERRKALTGRIRTLVRLARAASVALSVLLRTRQLDLTPWHGILTRPSRDPNGRGNAA
jgi:DNA-binding transcriptional regulator GbsR (MarR family)